jgi:hypothetical protein
MPAYSCSECGRAYTQPLERLVDLIRMGRTRCQICGGGLAFPDEVLAAISVRTDSEGPATLAQYTCRVCRRTWATSPEDLERRRGTGCRMCGAPLSRSTLEALDSFARERRVSGTGPRLKCLLCGRTTMLQGATPEDIHRCQFCGAGMRLPTAAGKPARVPPLTEPPASRAELVGIFRGVGKTDLMRFCGQVLLARSKRGEVGPAEARRVVAQLGAVDRWCPETGVPFWPLPVAEAEAAVPPVLFPGKPHDVDRHDAGSDVVFVVGESARRPSGESRVINAIGFATLLSDGFGLFVVEDEPAAGDQQRIRIALRPRGDLGVDLALFTQINDEAPEPASRKARTAFDDVVSRQKGPLVAYYGTLALFGTWAGGSAVAAATMAAITERLEYLGLGALAGAWAARLCLARAAGAG